MQGVTSVKSCPPAVFMVHGNKDEGGVEHLAEQNPFTSAEEEKSSAA